MSSDDFRRGRRSGGCSGCRGRADVADQLGLGLGDTIQAGEVSFQIRDVIAREPDRLSAGTFMLGPRVLIPFASLEATGLAGRGSLMEYRARVRFPESLAPAEGLDAVRAVEPERGWEFQSPDDAAERVRQVAGRTTTFLGVSGLAAFAIGLTGAWAAVAMWIGRRSRTIAQFRLSGATASTVVSLRRSGLCGGSDRADRRVGAWNFGGLAAPGCADRATPSGLVVRRHGSKHCPCRGHAGIGPVRRHGGRIVGIAHLHPCGRCGRMCQALGRRGGRQRLRRPVSRPPPDLPSSGCQTQ